MNWFSIGYFFVVTLTTGTLVDLLVKNWQGDWLEKLVMRFGVGLAALSVIGVILNLLHLPLDHRLFFAIGVLILGGAIARNRTAWANGVKPALAAAAQDMKARSFWYALLVLVLFAVTLQMYLAGSFGYSYFEDTDPWGYAAVADYIGENRTFTVPYYSLHYSEPYTQGYQIVMGVLSQTNASVYWTMKYFSALVNAFGVLFMFFFVRRLSRDEETALLASVFLFAVPAWVSHFVFSLHYNMTIFVVLLYVLAQFMRDAGRPDADFVETAPFALNCRTGWMWIGIIVYASMLTNHFSSVFHASIFCAIFILTRILAERKIDWKPLMVCFGGAILSLAFFIPAYARHWWLIGTKEQLGGIRALFPLLRQLVTPLGLVAVASVLAAMLLVYKLRNAWQPGFERWLMVRNRGLVLWFSGLAVALIILLLPLEFIQTYGTGDREYLPVDFFTASAINLMNNPIGLGPVLMIVVLLSFLWATVRIAKLFTQGGSWGAVSYAWIITAFILVLGKYLSIAISPFRVWTFLGLFASLFAAWGVISMVRSLTANRWVSVGMIAILAALLVPTTYLPKYRLNTMTWQDHTIGVPASHELFVWMRDGGIPKNSVVAHLCGNSEFLSGYDMNPPLWNAEFHPRRGQDPYFVARPLELTPKAFAVLRNADVEYVTMGASCLWQAPVPVEQEEAYGYLIRSKMDESLDDPRLTLIKSTDLEVLLKLN